MNFLNVSAILCIGLLIGVEFAVSAFVNPVVWELDFAAQAEPIRLFARRLGAAMPVWYIASLLLLLSETIIHRHESLVVLLGIATAILGAVIVLTLLFLVPINNRLARMDTDAWTEGARREHQTWDVRHRARIFALLVAMVFFLVGIGI